MQKHTKTEMKKQNKTRTEYKSSLIASIQFTKPMQIELSQLLWMMFNVEVQKNFKTKSQQNITWWIFLSGLGGDNWQGCHKTKCNYECAKANKLNTWSKKRLADQPVSENPSRADYIALCALSIQLVMFDLLLIEKHPSHEHELSMLGLLWTAHL